LRDGGANGANYIYNASAVAGFQARLGALAKGFDNTTSFSSATELPPNQSLMQLAGGSAGWIEGLRATAGNRAESTRALRDRAESSLSNAMGVNLDQEMALLLETEKSYQASAKVMGVINGLYSSLFGAVG
jgi:flagellar hook-associated protein 1 FlgK